MRLHSYEEGGNRMGKRILEAVLTALALGLAMFVVSLGSTYFFADKGIVRVGTSVKMENNIYQLSIDVHNFNSNPIEKLRVVIPDNISIDKIRPNQSVNITKVSNNLGTSVNSIFEIERVSEKQKLNLVFILNKDIKSKNIIIEKGKNSLKIEYFEDVKSPFRENLIILTLSAILYSLIFFITNYYSNKKSEVKRQKLADEIASLNKEVEKMVREYNQQVDLDRSERENMASNLQKRIDEVAEELEKERHNYLKHKLLLLSKIKDFKKENDFWRDTIRKILYDSDKTIKPENVFAAVTKTLGTYKVYNPNAEEFDTIKFMAKIINNDD